MTLTVRGLRVGIRDAGQDVLEATDLDVEAGEIIGLVGESGSGKTTLALALLGYSRRGLEIAGGDVAIGASHVLRLDERELRQARGRIVSYVPQDPAAALNPALSIGRQLRQTLDAHRYGADGRERDQRIAETLRDVRLPDDPEFLRRYPHQLSGGQQQRVVLAAAFACRPSVIVLDEPTTGLDVTTQAHVIETVRAMATTYGTATVYVTHDLAVVSSLAHRIVVMYAGSVVEDGPTDAIFLAPGHPYTAKLIAAVPTLAGPRQLQGIPGRAPSATRRPAGCAFAPRCPLVEPRCLAKYPELVDVAPRHRVRCVRAGQPAARIPVTPGVGAARAPDGEALLAVHQLDAWHGTAQVLHRVDVEVRRGECLAVVGESGSGKTTLARAIAGLHHHHAGRILLGGAPLDPVARNRPHEVRRRIQYVFQNPYSSLNPRRTVGQSILRTLALARLPRAAALLRVDEMLERVALPSAYADRYPEQLSGGERQRVAIARALVAEPELIICDEVTSALDVSVQATIVELLAELQRELQVSLIFVTHNMPLVRTIADRIAVLRRGTIVEDGSAEAVLAAPQDPYTRQLIADTPVVLAAAAG